MAFNCAGCGEESEWRSGTFPGPGTRQLVIVRLSVKRYKNDIKHLLALLLFMGPLGATPVTVVTWNVANYLPVSRRTQDGFRPDYPKPECEKAALRACLLGLLPDVVLLQEMGAAPYLREFQDDLASDGLPLPHAALGDGPDEDRHVALLSRWPLRAVRTLVPEVRSPRAASGKSEPAPEDAQEAASRRGALVAVVDTPDGPLCVCVLHLKSRRTVDELDPEARAWRAAEARALRDALETSAEVRSGMPVVLGGDCNSGPASAELAALATRGERTLWRRLPATDFSGATWTYARTSTGDYGTIDHLFLREGANVPRPVRAWVVPCGGETTPCRPSDHRPVAALLELGKPAADDR